VRATGPRRRRRFLPCDGLARHDYLLDITTIVAGPGELTSPSEPVFVPRETTLSEVLVHDAGDLRRTQLAASSWRSLHPAQSLRDPPAFPADR